MPLVASLVVQTAEHMAESPNYQVDADTRTRLAEWSVGKRTVKKKGVLGMLDKDAMVTDDKSLKESIDQQIGTVCFFLLIM